MAVLAWAGLADVAQAQIRTVQDEQDLINWYYAATYGTGIYKAGDRTVGVIQIPLTHTLRQTSDDAFGLRLHVPITVGVYDYSFDDIFNQGLPSRLSTLSVMPGLEMEMRMTSRWTLRPYASAGMGWELDGDESAWIYDAGLRSRFLLAEDRGVELSLLNRLSLAGFYPQGGPNEPFSLFAIGLDVLVPTELELFGRPLRVSLTPVVYYYFRRLDFPEFDAPDNRIGTETEFAVMLSAARPWTVAGIDFDRIGIAVRSSNDVTGYRLVTSLPF